MLARGVLRKQGRAHAHPLVDGWRALANGPDALAAPTDRLLFNYGWGGPRAMNLSPQIDENGPDNDRFGMVPATGSSCPPADGGL